MNPDIIVTHGLGGSRAVMKATPTIPIMCASSPDLQGVSLIVANFQEIATLALKQKLPSIGAREFAETGGLLAYDIDRPAQWRRAAYFVDRILKGANPSELPLERPTKFELIVNMKTAKALGITIPQSVLVRADRVIE